MHATELELVTDSPADSSRVGRLSPIRQPTQGSATVVERAASSFTLESGGVQIEAQRAASCLLEPALGDRVWFVAEPEPNGQQRGYVIAVLERSPDAQLARLSVEGDTELRVHGGQLTIAASDDLQLRSDKRLALQGDELQLRARLGRVLLDECSMVLRSLFAHVTKSTLVAKVLESFADRVAAHSRTSSRTVEELDHVQAGAIHYKAQTTAQIGAQHALISAGELVKLDGGQIHLG